MVDERFPKPEEIQKEFEEFVRKRFGDQVQVISQEVRSGEGADEEDLAADAGQNFKDLETVLEFDYKPKDVKEYLDRFVVGQDEAKKAISTAVCDHYNHVAAYHRADRDGKSHALEHYAKQNLLILGPTGVGKTYMIRQISKLIGVPFVKADATRFSEAGYMGANVEDLVRDLVNQADGQIEKAEYGIVYLDEADKLASSRSHGGRDVSGRGVQLGLLKLMEETEVDLRSGQDPASQIQAFMDIQKKGKLDRQVVNTRHILFIVSGAFDQLGENVRKRLNLNRIGFGSSDEKSQNEIPASSFLGKAETRDFIDYGFEPEFVGRLPVRVACEELTKDDLRDILLSSEGNVLEQYRSDFAGYNIEFKLTDGAVGKIAEKAAEEKTGARGLVTVLERTFRDFKFELPSTGIRAFDVDEETVDHPEETMSELLEQNRDQVDDSMLEDVDRFVEDFKRNHGFELRIRKPAKVALVKMAAEENRSVFAFCEKKFADFQHGLSIISQRTGKKSFVIERKAIDDPDKELSKWVVDSFGKKTGEGE